MKLSLSRTENSVHPQKVYILFIYVKNNNASSVILKTTQRHDYNVINVRKKY